jgi:spoIIIJ-associated protein
MSSFEYEGKNVDKAVKKACEELSLTSDELNYEVLSYGSSGIFGLAGAKKARILVKLPGKANEAEDAKAPIETSDISDVQDHRPLHETASGEQPVSEFPDNPLDLGREVLQRIVDSITNDATISAEEDSERIVLNVVGGKAGVLIGKKGQTLEAIQSIVEKIVNKHNNHGNNDKIRVRVDVEGYLETRKTNLEKLAMRLAEKSKRIRKPISLGQMSAYDRRIVHIALKDDPDVRTKSRGEGYMRKLVIFPKKNHMQRQPRMN